MLITHLLNRLFSCVIQTIFFSLPFCCLCVSPSSFVFLTQTVPSSFVLGWRKNRTLYFVDITSITRCDHVWNWWAVTELTTAVDGEFSQAEVAIKFLHFHKSCDNVSLSHPEKATLSSDLGVTTHHSNSNFLFQIALR